MNTLIWGCVGAVLVATLAARVFFRKYDPERQTADTTETTEYRNN